MDPILQAKAQELEQKRGELAAIFKAHTNAEGSLALPTEQIAEVNARNDELTKLGKAYDEHRALVEIATDNERQLKGFKTSSRGVPYADAPREQMEVLEERSLGQKFVESAGFKQINGSRGPLVEIKHNVKAVLSTNVAAGGYPPQVLRSGVLIYSAQSKPTLIDHVPVTETTQNAYKYMLETVYTNAAAETAEGALYSEAALTYAEQVANIRKIAVFVPITDEQLADEPDMRGIVDNRLTLMLKQRLNAQIATGNGAGVNLTGLLNTAGIQTQALGVDTRPDAVYKAMVKLQTIGFVDPSAVWFNPTDWQNIRLQKTATGHYLWGSPDQAGPERIWGLPIAEHVAITQGTAIVGDFMGYTRLVHRSDIEFEVSNSHSDFFQRGQLAIRAQLRVAFVVYRPAAICTVTGL